MLQTLLDRYFLKKLLDYLILGIVLFTLVLFFSDALLDFMKDLRHYGISWNTTLTLICLQIPRIVVEAIPMSALLATLMVYNNLNNQFEIIALRMSGISLARIMVPALLLGVLASIGCFMLNDYVVPKCFTLSRNLKTFAINQQNLPATQENFTYKEFDDHKQLKRLIYISHFRKKKLGYSTILDLTTPMTVQIIQAHSGYWGQQTINLNQASVYTVSSNQKLSNTTYADHLSLSHFIAPVKNVLTYKPREMSFLQLYTWIKTLKRGHHVIDSDVYVSLWKRLTVPLSSIVLVLIAVPLALTSPRRLSNRGFIMALIVLFLYYLLRAIFEQLGKDNVIDPMFAVPIPLLIILLAALAMYTRKNVRL